MQIEIDGLCIDLLVPQHPVAADLKLTAAALKFNTDLEGLGDLAVSIAKRAVSLMRQPVITPMIDTTAQSIVCGLQVTTN